MKMKQNDTRPYARATLYSDEEAETVLDCSTAVVSNIKFTMKPQGGGAAKVDEEDCFLVTDGEDGRVEYRWTAGDTDTPGVYQCEYQVTYVGGGVQTFPEDGFLSVEIVAELS
jgi:hypothetical protein